MNRNTKTVIAVVLIGLGIAGILGKAILGFDIIKAPRFSGISINKAIDKVAGSGSMNIDSYEAFKEEIKNKKGITVYDEIKETDANINELEIDSSFEDIKYFVEDRDNIKVHFYGTRDSKSNKKIELKLEKSGNRAKFWIEREKKFFIFNLGDFDDEAFVVEVHVPKSFVEEVDFNSASGDIFIPTGEFEELKINTASGEIIAGEVEARRARINTASGEVAFEVLRSEDVDFNSASGDFVINQSAEVKELNGNTASGSFSLNGFKGKSDLDAVSGDIEIVVEDIDENLDLNTVSGDVTLKFANEPDCTLIFKTLSGGFDSDFSNKNDKDDDSLVGKNLNVKYGNGNVRIKVETVSGGLRVTE